MKLLYFFIVLSFLLFGSYLVMNDFNFDNATFSNYLIKALFIILLLFLTILGGGFLMTMKKKKNYKGIMTIRQYYQYKSAR
jgi:hypothetical protein